MEFEHIINSDPTLKFFIRDTQISPDLFEHQLNLKIAAIKIALYKWIDSL